MITIFGGPKTKRTIYNGENDFQLFSLNMVLCVIVRDEECLRIVCVCDLSLQVFVFRLFSVL